jgi:hypothetical protein
MFLLSSQKFLTLYFIYIVSTVLLSTELEPGERARRGS